MSYNLTLVSSDKMAKIREAVGRDLFYENWLTWPESSTYDPFT